MHRSRKSLMEIPFIVRLACVTFWASAKAHFSSSPKRFTPLFAPSERRMTGAQRGQAVVHHRGQGRNRRRRSSTPRRD